MKLKWTNKELDFLQSSYPYLNSHKLEDIWFEKTGVHRTASAIRTKAKRLKIRASKYTRIKKHDYAICLNCGKKFYRNAHYINVDVRFCSPSCRGEYKARKCGEKLRLSDQQYNKVYHRDYNYIIRSFESYAKKNKYYAFEDLIEYFWKYQFKYYVEICSRRNKRIKLDKFILYARLHVYRDMKKDYRLKGELIRELKTLYKDEFDLTIPTWYDK